MNTKNEVKQDQKIELVRMPKPLIISEYKTFSIILNKYGEEIVKTDKQTAADIVKCVNSYDALIKENEKLRTMLEEEGVYLESKEA